MIDEAALRDIKNDEAALRQAYVDAGGALNSHDSKHNSCPFCKDETGFSLFRHDGQARWKCWSKCSGAGGTIIDFLMQSRNCGSKDAIRAALEQYGRGTAARQSAQPTPPAAPERKGKLHLLVDAAIEANIWRMERDPKNTDVVATRYWHYTDEKGEPLLVVVRYDYKRSGEQKKEFAPIHRDGNGWRLGLGPWAKRATNEDGTPGPVKLVPMYNLAGLRRANGGTLYVVEGEKCADALIELGLCATTSQGGSGRAKETNWRPAAAFSEIIIWQDVDAAPPEGSEDSRTVGEKYAQTVAELIVEAASAQERAAPRIIIVDPRGLGLVEGQDVFDFVEAQRQDGKDDAAILAAMAYAAERYASVWRVEIDVSIEIFGQPKPLSAAPKGLDNRPEITNYTTILKSKKNKDGEDTTVPVAVAKTIDQVMEQIQEVTGGWPCRVRAPGAKSPLLFADRGEGSATETDSADGETKFSELLTESLVPSRVRWIAGVESFKAWLHERSRLRVKGRTDSEGNNFVEFGDCYQSFGGSWGVGEYLGVEVRPHWPPIRGHYYAWTAGKYKPTGEMLRKLLGFFSNCRDDASRAILAAALFTPGWGGRYGARPMIVVTAPDRGYGKSTIAEVIAKIWGGHISINLQGRDEDELLQRLLTPDAMTRRVGIIGNVKGTLSSSMLEELVTAETLSGKRMYSGEASRPNTMTYFITANGVKLSRDIALRSYFINLTKPEYQAQWDTDLAQFVQDHGRDIIADIGMVLTQPSRLVCSVSDRWPLWRREVLTRACEFVGAAPNDVMGTILLQRDACDDDLEEATLIIDGLVGWLIERYKMITKSVEGVMIYDRPANNVFVTSTEMVEIWPQVLGKKMGAKQIKHILTEHMEAGRLLGLCFKERSNGNGYEVDKDLIGRYIEGKRDREGGDYVAA
jgi:hypothetical protein